MPIPFAALVPFIAQGINIAGNAIGANRQEKANKELAAYQYDRNLEMMHYQNIYNSPRNQMARFKEAGLNPNLVYGQGTSGNMSSAPSYPDIGRVDYQSMFADVGTKLMQSKLMQAQADLTKQKTVESGVKQDLAKAQTNLVKANPYLNSAYVNSMVSLLESSARLKENEAGVLLETQFGHQWTRGQEKIIKEIEILSQRFDLNKADQAIKARVLESKEFQNALQQIQVEWMKDGEITPQHIFQGIMMILQKMM